MQTEWDARKTAALAALDASKESMGRFFKSVTDHASGAAEIPILVDSSWEGLMSTGSPGKDIEKQPQPNTLPSERTEENSQATGMKKEAQTLVSPQETSQGGTIPYSSSE